MSEATKLSGFINNTFWSQAIQHATLIINLTNLSHGSSNKSAFEAITNKSPTIILSKLLPFGCPGVMKIESNRSKLEPKGTEVIVVGYSLISQSYLVFNPITSRLSTTVNFQPDLSMFYDKSLQHSPTTFGNASFVFRSRTIIIRFDA